MSMRQVLLTVEGLLLDRELGLAAKYVGIADAYPALYARIAQREFRFVPWRLSAKLKPTDAIQVCVRPTSGIDRVKIGQEPDADSNQRIEIVLEAAAADVQQLQDQLVVSQTALLQSLVHLIAFSNEHGGTVLDIRGDDQGSLVDFAYGAFDARVSTSGGWSALLTILERSTE